VERAAAGLWLVTDRRLDRGPTPKWVVNLANEKGDPILEPGWIEEAINRLDSEARENCSCRCHGQKTQWESDHKKSQSRNLKRTGARLQKVLDERLGRPTPDSVLRLAAEDDQ
jgi:hypothetical protein